MSPNDYLFIMVHEFLEFRFPELEAVSEIINHKGCIQNHTYTNESSVFSCQLENDQIAHEISQRTILLKTILKLYYRAENLEKLLNAINNDPFDSFYKFEKDDTFKIDVYTFGKIYSQNEKVDKIEELISALKLEEKELKVCLKDNMVKHRFYYVEEWIDASEVSQDQTSTNKILKACYFGKFLCNGQSTVPFKYNLKERGFIGNTSMDPTLSLIMANMALVKEPVLMYDPFVGTGSLLVGAAHFGAHVMGADLDYNLIHSRGLSSRSGQKYRKKDETIRNNLKQYGLESKFIDVMVADFSTSYINDHIKFDCIISDPPYGIREKTKRLASAAHKDHNHDQSHESHEQQPPEQEHENSRYENDAQVGESHANKQPTHQFSPSYVKHSKYMLSDIFHDLLKFSSKHLSIGGRLVYWLPIYLELDRTQVSHAEVKSLLKNMIPTHPCLDLINFSEQRLNKFTSRILITMVRNNMSRTEMQLLSRACVTVCTASVDNLDACSINQLITQQQPVEASSNANAASKHELNYLDKFRDNYFSTKK